MRRVVQAWMGAGALAATAMPAQTHVAKRPETVVRAVGVYEWTGEEGKPKASRLVPVSVFINGRLEDAGVYLARPVPFALETGTIFEVERAGEPQGTLELAYARHLQSGSVAPQAAGTQNDMMQYDQGWLAVGAYKPKLKEAVVAAKKSGPLPQVTINGGKGPRFSDKSGSKAKPDPADKGDPATKSGVDRSTAVGGGTTVSAAEIDPAIARQKADADGAKDKVDPNDDADRPTLKKRTPAQAKDAKKQRDQASVAGVGQLNADPDRPNLHRGKPATRMEEEDLPPLQGAPKDMRQEVAVSDAKTRPEHAFARPWESDAERAEVTNKLQAIARAQLLASSGQGIPDREKPDREKVAHAATMGASAVERRKRSGIAPAGAAISLKDEALHGYTLSYGGAATYVYTATSSAAKGAASYVTVVAQREPLGDLKVALTNVTDSAHLDRTPWMRLVDVVDAEASNRASLLFELRAQTTRQFALYRVIGAQAEQVFVTTSVP